MAKGKKTFLINLEKLFQMIILLFLFNYIFNLAVKQSLSLYIHPRMNYLIYFSLFVIILFILFPVTKISSCGKKNFFKLKYFTFLFLLLLFYFIPKDIIQSDIADLRGVKIGNGTNVYKNDAANNSFDDSIKVDVSIDESNFIGTVNTMYNYPKDYINKSVIIKGFILKTNNLAKDQFVVIHYASDKTFLGLLCSYKKSEVSKLKNNQQIELIGTVYSNFTKFRKGVKIPVIRVKNYKLIPDQQSQAEDNAQAENSNNNINILIDESNFLETIDSIYKDQDDFINKNVTVTGFIFRSNEFNPNQFIIGRMAMFCCAADASVYGLLCSSTDPEILALKDKQWVELHGVIHSDTTKFSEGNKLPIIQVNNFKLAPASKNEYVYYKKY